jgi:peptidoglycan/LPS O-acetylase OafA/YrhL
MAEPRPQFRPDIEGLRGVMILLVVLFHAGVSAVAGGFVGVDVFFVLSGFFITGLLLREHSQTSRIDLTEFYGQRALRLSPPFIVVLLATLAAVMWLYAPIDRPATMASARAVAFYTGNTEFASGAVDYFSAGENPLLHTWSLAVEQQFYLVWPLLILLIVLIRRRPGDDMADADRVDNRSLLGGIALVGLLSLAASLWLTETAQPWAFFGMPTRIWEFALGAAIAVILHGRTDGAPAGATAFQVAGLLAIAFGVVTYDRATPYPGVAALAPALGAVALLLGGARAPQSFVSRGLSVAPLRWLGRMSYAWYLWHWPLVGVGGVLDRDLGVAGKLAWSAAALGLAWLTYELIERPSRDGRLIRVPRYWLAPAAFGASAVVALIAHGAMLAAERRVAQPEQRVFAAAREDRMNHDCWATTVDDAKGPCEFGDKQSATTIALLGDSHAEHWLGGLDRAGQVHGWKIVAMVKGGCPVADIPELMQVRLKRYYHECTRYREAMVQRIVAERPAAVILSSWDHYMPTDGSRSDWQVTPEMWRNGLRRTYARLAATGIPVVVIRGTPRTWFNVPSCLSRSAAKLPFAEDCAYDRDRSLSPAAIAEQTSAARGLDIRFVDLNDQICAAKRCGVIRNGVVVFTDDNHLTASFSRSVAPVLGERLAAAMSSRTSESSERVSGSTVPALGLAIGHGQ